MNVAIIGPGSAGLSIAILLYDAGVSDLAIYGSGAGVYKRPGSLSNDTFEKAEKSFGIKFWTDTRDPAKDWAQGHIKDFERLLYKMVEARKIPVIKQDFVGLVQDIDDPAILVQDSNGQTERVSAKYVFDCSGSARVVVHAVNKIIEDEPLRIKKFAKAPFPKHFIAYVAMSLADSKTLYDITLPLLEGIDDQKKEASFSSATKDPLTYARNIVKLRQLGWLEMDYPRCYGVPFSYTKTCLYLETPDHLEEKNYDQWVQTVLECYAPVKYSHLKPSKKNNPKPRFKAFTLSTRKITHSAYDGFEDDLPNIIALGDSQIDPYYFKANGIKNGVKRIKLLLDSLSIQDGEISHCDIDGYNNSVKDSLLIHQNIIKLAFYNRRMALINALNQAEPRLLEAITLTTDNNEITAFTALINEVHAIIYLLEAERLITKHRQKNVPEAINDLRQAHDYLLKSAELLPTAFKEKHQQIIALLEELADKWENLGDMMFDIRMNDLAIELYLRSLELYKHPVFGDKYQRDQIHLLNNLSKIYNVTKNYVLATDSAREGLLLYMKSPQQSKLLLTCNQLIYHLIDALSGHAQSLPLSESLPYIQSAKDIYNAYSPSLTMLSPSQQDYLKKRCQISSGSTEGIKSQSEQTKSPTKSPRFFETEESILTASIDDRAQHAPQLM